jgi:hypothetical protein
MTSSFKLRFDRFSRSCDPCDVYNSFIMLFFSTYIVWYIVSYLFYLLDCMCLCVAIDGAQFEDRNALKMLLSSSNTLKKASGP